MYKNLLAAVLIVMSIQSLALASVAQFVNADSILLLSALVLLDWVMRKKLSPMHVFKQ